MKKAQNMGHYPYMNHDKLNERALTFSNIFKQHEYKLLENCLITAINYDVFPTVNEFRLILRDELSKKQLAELKKKPALTSGRLHSKLAEKIAEHSELTIHAVSRAILPYLGNPQPHTEHSIRKLNLSARQLNTIHTFYSQEKTPAISREEFLERFAVKEVA